VIATFEPLEDRRIGAIGHEDARNGHFGFHPFIATIGDFFLREVMRRKKIKMHHNRQALLRMRQGDSDRDIARSGLIGRRTTASLRPLASARDWFATDLAAPDDDATIAEGLVPAKRATTTVSSLVAHRERIPAWPSQGVSGVVIHTVLKRASDPRTNPARVLSIAGQMPRAKSGQIAKVHIWICPL